MAAKKNKGVKLNLNEFLSEDTSWAAASMDDEDDDIIPTNDHHYDENDNEPLDNYRERNYEKRDRPRRNDAPQKPIPDHGPWVAYVGNLPFNATDDDIGNFFAEHCDVIDVKLVVDHGTGRSKGFAYVTFDNVESLREALGANDAEFLGRNIRVDVAEVQRDRPRREYKEREKKVREPSRADTVDKWERGVKKPVVEKPMRDSRRNDRPRREDRPRRDYDDKYQQRKPITIQPRTSSDPIGAPAKTSKSNPFGDAKPRDELEFQKKKEEERQRRLREKEKQKQQQSFPKTNSKYGGRQNKNAWKGKNTGGNRNFDNIRDNMGKVVTKTKEPKKYKPVQVRKEAASIPCKNIYATLQEQE